LIYDLRLFDLRARGLKRLLTIIGICVGLAAVLLLLVMVRFMPSASARRAWKDRAITDISGRFNDSWPSNELALLARKGTNVVNESDGWLSERLIVMRNGEWIAYANICQKEDSRIQDLFVGRGSDGRWYYSTFHFCKRMLVMWTEDQSDDLATFAKTYYLQTFDGRSDECLQKTWPTNQMNSKEVKQN
jgi:hypothetical protein